MLLHHDNEPSDRSCNTIDAIYKEDSTLFEYLPYAPDLAPRNNGFFSIIREHVRVKLFSSNNKITVCKGGICKGWTNLPGRGQNAGSLGQVHSISRRIRQKGRRNFASFSSKMSQGWSIGIILLLKTRLNYYVTEKRERGWACYRKYVKALYSLSSALLNVASHKFIFCSNRSSFYVVSIFHVNLIFYIYFITEFL